MLGQNHGLVEKYFSLVNVIQKNLGSLKGSIDKQTILDCLEPLDGSSSPLKKETLKTHSKTASMTENGPNKMTNPNKNKLSAKDIRIGTLTKKTDTNQSAKDIRGGLTKQSETNASSKDIRKSILVRK